MAGHRARCGAARRKGAVIVDIVVEGHGSPHLLRPLPDQASDWLHGHLSEDGHEVVSARAVESIQQPGDLDA